MTQDPKAQGTGPTDPDDATAPIPGPGEKASAGPPPAPPPATPPQEPLPGYPAASYGEPAAPGAPATPPGDAQPPEAAPSWGTPVPSPPPAGADAMQRQHAADLRRSVPQSRSFRRIVSIDSLANIHFHWLSIGRSLLLRRPVAGIVLEAGQRIEVARVAAAAA